MNKQTGLNKSNPRVLLGMSGGTDSSVAAMLLQEAGYEVTGVTFHFWEGDGTAQHLADARHLADRLHIPHYILDLRDRFRTEVVNYFIDEYLHGRTPLPCVMCNNLLKWPLLRSEADRLGISFIATGHYVQTAHCGDTRCIRKGVDADKDQSFFLWGLDDTTLSRALFPLGHLTKPEVRAYAAQRGFERVATKRDSMGVCFCPGDYHTFLHQHADLSQVSAGNFVDEAGRVVGRHKGFPFYTVGQRRGLAVQFRYPVFVKSICTTTNTLVLAPLSGMYRQEFRIKGVCSPNRSLLMDREWEPLICRIRYRKQATPCRVQLSDDGHEAVVQLLEPLESIAPGQSAVFYRGDFVVGGGYIV